MLSLWLLVLILVQSASCYIISHRFSLRHHNRNRSLHPHFKQNSKSNHQQPIQNPNILLINLYQSFITCLSSSHEDNKDSITRIRLNKVFKATHSRREADKLIASGRVSVNGQRIESKGGFFVIPHVDIVRLDGVVVKGWEDMNAIDSIDHGTASTTTANATGLNRQVKSHFEYIKYYKPVGVTCTTDPKIKNNIIDSIQRNGYRSPHRIYPVGRLDKDTSGL